jgi:hypothetical protein
MPTLQRHERGPTRGPDAGSRAFGVCSHVGGGAVPQHCKPVESRTGRRVVWNQGGADDNAAATRVHELMSRELTVESAIQIALVNNKGLQATYEALSVAQADLVQAGLLQNPIFGAAVAFPIAGSAQTGFGLSVSQDFLSIFLLAARKKVAAAELRAPERRVGDAVLRMASDVEVAFYKMAAAQQIAAMRRTILEAGDAGLDLAQRQHAPGNISDRSGPGDARLQSALHGYMPMGNVGMGGMMDMGHPKNTLPMAAGKGPSGDIEMGGMFTVVKVREGITSYDDPGWYAQPPGSMARKVSG